MRMPRMRSRWQGYGVTKQGGRGREREGRRRGRGRGEKEREREGASTDGKERKVKKERSERDGMDKGQHAGRK